MTETFTLEPENYHPKDIAKYCHLSPSGNRALFISEMDTSRKAIFYSKFNVRIPVT